MSVAMEFDAGDLTRLGRSLESSFSPSAMPQTIKDVSFYLGNSVKRRFDTGTAPDGSPWEPLKNPRNRSRDKRARGGSGQKPLRDSGLLMASATGQPGAEGAVRETGPFHLVQGTNLEYAGVHNFGATIHRQRREAPTSGGKKFWAWQPIGEGWVYARRIKAHTITIPARQFIGLNDADMDKITMIALDNLTRGTP